METVVMGLRGGKSLYAKAIAFGTKAHKDMGQKYDQYDYSYHLNATSDVIDRFHTYADSKTYLLLLTAAWLHDVLEDTPTTREQLEKEFGKEVADLVFSVTNESGINRKERMEKTYPKIWMHPLGVALKLADRIANVEASLKNNRPEFFKMYKKEFPSFKKALIDPKTNHGMCIYMWAHLENLFKGGAK